MTSANYGPAALLLLGLVIVPGALATTTRYARRLGWQARVCFGLVVGLAVLGLCVLAVIVALSPGYVFWPALAGAVAVLGVLGHWRGSTRKVLDVEEVEETPAPRLRRGPGGRPKPRMSAPGRFTGSALDAARATREEPQP